MKRTVFFLSDSTGMTVESLGRSLLVQFPQIKFDSVTRPFIDTLEKAHRVCDEINQVLTTSEQRPIVINTIIDDSINGVIKDSDCFYIDIFSTFLSPIEQELGIKSAHNIGHPTIFKDNQLVDESYMQRIDAMHFAMNNDDGMHLHRYDDADIVLIGVSRSGKTPTSIYLGMQYGIKVANYPLTPEDLERPNLPKALQSQRDKLFGLTIMPNRLAEIRNERKPNSHYANLQNCMHEVRTAQSLYRQYRIPNIDTTQLSVEEIAARILVMAGIERHVSSL